MTANHAMQRSRACTVRQWNVYRPGPLIAAVRPQQFPMVIPKPNGRRVLLDCIRSRIGCAPLPSLNQVLTAYELTFAAHRIDQTTDGLTFVAWPTGSLRGRILDVALSWDHGWDDEEWAEAPGQIMACLKIPIGPASYFVPRVTFRLESEDRGRFHDFFASLRNLRAYRWYGQRRSADFCLTLRGEDEFFEMASKVIPMMEKSGLLNCGPDGSE